MAHITIDNHRLRLIVRYTLLSLIALIFIFPLIFMLVSSFKPDHQLLADTASLRAFLPVGDISLSNYDKAFERAPIFLFMFNSLLVTAVTVVLSLLLCSMAGFSFVYLNWRGKQLAFSIIVATLIVPFETIAIPMLLMVSKLPWLGLEGLTWGWLNTYRVQIVPFIADGLTIFLFTQYFKDLPRELIEAARVEGSSWWQVYWRIVMPLSGPVIATAAILKFLVMYNQYLWPIMVTQQEQYRPVLVGLQYFFQLNTAWGEVMAYLTLITMPVLAFLSGIATSFYRFHCLNRRQGLIFRSYIMTIALKDQWIWDSWYFREGDTWHGYFLKADKALLDPERRHLNVSQGHATSTDLVHWQHHGTCFAPAKSPAWDDSTTWTGSVVCDESGLYHLFYTGTCLAENSLYQRVGHATSTDLHHWQRVGDGLCLDLVGENAAHYEHQHQKGFWHDRAMRDPWVMKDPKGEGWLMFLPPERRALMKPTPVARLVLLPPIIYMTGSYSLLYLLGALVN
ncbi:ABC transporter permease subunit [Marinomonas rhodophyticola]|uniref:ABC transporter permease subunit n=1 Tax=Marinomonas rhodophyticola TaxID=2992803 RepID=A0ABT3KC95_9GAMM|nr:ABC transporter permease subunit [Marinomonas sp. KJ51-3]MCW4628152.1 ABC transporter permease subunit [Marinomonas sp. KJ51-3]